MLEKGTAAFRVSKGSRVLGSLSESIPTCTPDVLASRLQAAAPTHRASPPYVPRQRQGIVGCELASVEAIPVRSEEGDRGREGDDNTKGCPYGAASIKRMALVCRFCGYDFLPGEPTWRGGGDDNPQTPVLQAQSSGADGVQLGCGLLSVLPLLLLLGALVLFLFTAVSPPR